MIPGILQRTSHRDSPLVSSLIIEEPHQWNEEVIRTKFSDNLAEKILSIPLSIEGCRDFTS
jgi:hypothetical protein